MPLSYYNIRNLYKPIQPTVKISDDGVSYSELLPDADLQQYIYCYWDLKTVRPLNRCYNYQVVSDGCIDIFFELNDPEEIYIMGFCDSFSEFQIDNQFNYIGIRFLPSIFPMLFNIDASELSNRAEHLKLVLPDLHHHIQSITHESIDKIGAKLDAYFRRHITENHFIYDKRFGSALDIILNNAGVVNIEKDLVDGISSRHLRRLFKFYIGDSVKTFCKVVRFQSFLNTNLTIDKLKSESLFYDFGYYDQSHFINDFKQFYGRTPTQAFAK